MKTNHLTISAALGAAFIALMSSHSLLANDDISAEAFVSPSKNYQPKTWMHAMNGNLSKPGFTQDFASMSEAGIGGAIFFHVHRSNKPYSSRGPVRFGTDEFIDTLVHAAGEADKHGLELGVHNADGWSSSGGPWITPEMSMKRITWSEQTVTGNQTMTLKQPGFAEGFYRDIAVIAMPATSLDEGDGFSEAKITVSDKNLDPTLLLDADWDTELAFTENEQSEYWIEVEVDTATPLRSLQIETPTRHGDAKLLISDDGKHFTTAIDKLRRPRTGARMWAFSPNLDTITAKYFRFVFDKPIIIKRFDLWSTPRVPHWLSMNSMERGKLSLSPKITPKAIVKASDVLVLNTGDLPEQGLTLPNGQWRVLRFGYTSTGAFNVPATVEGEGLECDKMDPVALQFHFEQYVGKLVKKARAKGINSLKVTEIDSYEMGGQNWTKGIDETFKAKFGYDFIPWLPLLSGMVIESPEHTGAILQEYRQHLSDLMVENYFGEFTRLTKKYGMESYIEPYGWGPFDELRAGGKADRTMGEFWVRNEEYPGRVEAAISSAHIYGKKIISAESFTSINTVNWYGHPYFYKHYGDKVWARGINETMFHRFAHQPNTHIKPGMTMDSIGSHIDRTQTWWDNGGVAWFSYLARGSYLLQQGVPVSDFLIHLGDLSPKAVGNRNNTNVPQGYNFDYVNTEVLINRLTVEDGWLVLPEGTRYKALQLHQSDYLNLETLIRVHDLVMQGATIIGQKPIAAIGYSEWKQQDKFSALADKIWGAGEEALRHVGEGRVSILPLNEAIMQLGYQVDLAINGEAEKLFAHRRIGKNDLYFFFNDKQEYQTLQVDLRNGDGKPEIWNLDTGNVESVEQFTRDGKRLTANLLVEPHGSRFLLIRRDDKKPEYNNQASALLKAVVGKGGQKIQGEWQVHFPHLLGGPGDVSFEALQDWTTHSESGIKHFSGTAKYTKTIQISSSEIVPNNPLYLDLGDVQHIAEVSVNGQLLGTLWKPPFALDIANAVIAGDNTIEVAITNTWVNRLIGDEALPDTSGYSMTGDTVSWINDNLPPPTSERVTFTGYNFFKSEDKQLLQPAGLIGPVRLIK